MSGSKPERCWSTTTSCENRRAFGAGGAAVGADVAASAPTTTAPAVSTPAQARARTGAGRGTVPPQTDWASHRSTTVRGKGNGPDPLLRGQTRLTVSVQPALRRRHHQRRDASAASTSRTRNTPPYVAI